VARLLDRGRVHDGMMAAIVVSGTSMTIIIGYILTRVRGARTDGMGAWERCSNPRIYFLASLMANQSNKRRHNRHI
jgi:hypothetical protein